MTTPPVTLRPLARVAALAVVPALVTVTPAPMATLPLVTLMPSSPVFLTLTFASDAALPAPGATRMPTPDRCALPSMVSGAAVTAAMPAPSPASVNALLVAASNIEMGPTEVAIFTLPGTGMGSVSGAGSVAAAFLT